MCLETRWITSVHCCLSTGLEDPLAAGGALACQAEVDTNRTLTSGIPFNTQNKNSFLLSHTVSRKSQAVDYISRINVGVVKCHSERFSLQANAFTLCACNGGCFRWADGVWPFHPACRSVSSSTPTRIARTKNHLVRVLSVGIMRSVCHAPRSWHSDFSEVLHRSLISWRVV